VAPQTGTPLQKMGWKHIKTFSELNIIHIVGYCKTPMFTLRPDKWQAKEPKIQHCVIGHDPEPVKN
jgi:hypothetical protein